MSEGIFFLSVPALSEELELGEDFEPILPLVCIEVGEVLF